jgi:hypothetical protein
MSGWAENRSRWIASGAFDRITAAIAGRTPINVKRTSGETVTGYALCNGYGGAGVLLAWGDGAERWEEIRLDRYRLPPGVMSKTVPTEDFLEWNPAIAGEEQP